LLAKVYVKQGQVQFVEPRERGVQDAAHSAVLALFQAWLLGLSRAQKPGTTTPRQGMMHAKPIALYAQSR